MQVVATDAKNYDRRLYPVLVNNALQNEEKFSSLRPRFPQQEIDAPRTKFGQPSCSWYIFFRSINKGIPDAPHRPLWCTIICNDTKINGKGGRTRARFYGYIFYSPSLQIMYTNITLTCTITVMLKYKLLRNKISLYLLGGLALTSFAFLKVSSFFHTFRAWFTKFQ